MTADTLLESLIADAVNRRADLFDVPETNAFRVFNGFYEGAAELCVDKYADTAVIPGCPNANPPRRTTFAA